MDITNVVSRSLYAHGIAAHPCPSLPRNIHFWLPEIGAHEAQQIHGTPHKWRQGKRIGSDFTWPFMIILVAGWNHQCSDRKLHDCSFRHWAKLWFRWWAQPACGLRTMVGLVCARRAFESDFCVGACLHRRRTAGWMQGQGPRRLAGCTDHALSEALGRLGTWKNIQLWWLSTSYLWWICERLMNTDRWHGQILITWTTIT